MPEQPDPALRPSRIHRLGQVGVLLLTGLSFVSGVAVWWGQAIQQSELVTPDWFRPALMLHGGLNPLLCILFGWLLMHHIRLGWRLRANWLSGLLMELTFGGLILTGAGLYYIGAEWRDAWVTAHRVLGLILPVALAVHWIAGLAWARQATRPNRPGN